MARAIRNELTITARFTTPAGLDDEALEDLETVISEYLTIELNAENVSTVSDLDDEGIVI